MYDLIVGFLLGLWGNIAVNELTNSFPRSKWTPCLLKLSTPWKYVFYWCFYSSYREARTTVFQLFNAWKRRDIESYMAAWDENAVLTEGRQQSLTTRESIRQRFMERCKNYESIRVDFVAIRNFEEEPDGSALFHMIYQFNLIKAGTRMPIVESTDEIYRLKRVGSKWLISHNYDHYRAIEK